MSEFLDGENEDGELDFGDDGNESCDLVVDLDGTTIGELEEDDWDLGERIKQPGWLEMDMAEDFV